MAALGLLIATAPLAAGLPVERGWRQAATRLAMPVYRPAFSAGLTLKRVLPGRSCPGEQLSATYNSPGGAVVNIYEGKPYFCGDPGEARLVGRPHVLGRRAYLYEYLGGNGALYVSWCTGRAFSACRRPDGTGVFLMVEGNDRVDRAVLLRIARSMRRISTTLSAAEAAPGPSSNSERDQAELGLGPEVPGSPAVRGQSTDEPPRPRALSSSATRTIAWAMTRVLVTAAMVPSPAAVAVVRL
jgi:hypothetical protein